MRKKSGSERVVLAFSIQENENHLNAKVLTTQRTLNDNYDKHIARVKNYSRKVFDCLIYHL